MIMIVIGRCNDDAMRRDSDIDRLGCERKERVCVCVFHFELVKMSESGGGWVTMRWFDRSSESKGERNDGDSPEVCMLWLWLS